MATTVNDLENDVRVLIASPDETEVPKSVIRNILTERALSWINRRRPGRYITSFTTVADTQDYDEKPAGSYRVSKVWWMDADFEFFSPSMRFMPSEQDFNVQMSGFSILDNPALATAFYKKVAAYKNTFKGSGKETDEGKIRLEPVPGATGDNVYFEYTAPRWTKVVDVPEVFLEGVRYIAASMVLDIMFIKRGFVRSGRTFTGGGGANERTMAQDFLAKAEQEVPKPSAFFVRG